MIFNRHVHTTLSVREEAVKSLIVLKNTDIYWPWNFHGTCTCMNRNAAFSFFFFFFTNKMLNQAVFCFWLKISMSSDFFIALQFAKMLF